MGRRRFYYPAMPDRRFPPAWTVENHVESFVVRDARRSAAHRRQYRQTARSVAQVIRERFVRRLGSVRMTERPKVTRANLLTSIETEFARLLGRSVASYMLGVRLHARAGEPNWNAEIGGDIGISVLGSFLVALDHVKADYDLDDDDRERLISGS
jgi:hypothetical protein